jgi:hypothetical protein
MASMMSSPRNRAVLGVDNPWNSDGFYQIRRFCSDNRSLKGKRA